METILIFFLMIILLSAQIFSFLFFPSDFRFKPVFLRPQFRKQPFDSNGLPVFVRKRAFKFSISAYEIFLFLF